MMLMYPLPDMVTCTVLNANMLPVAMNTGGGHCLFALRARSSDAVCCDVLSWACNGYEYLITVYIGLTLSDDLSQEALCFSVS